MVLHFKRLERLEVGYEQLQYTFEHEFVEMPKTLQHLKFNYVRLHNVVFLSDLTQLISLELNHTRVSNAIMTYIANNCLELQSLKIEGEFLYKYFKLVILIRKKLTYFYIYSK